MTYLHPRGFTLMLGGDVMLGRLVDQIMPQHVNEPGEQHHAVNILRHYGRSDQVSKGNPYRYVWGDVLPELLKADLRLINLETSITTSSKKWPRKAFNYRMHPGNVKILQEAKIDYCSLANNHILDFGDEGMFETMKALTRNNIAWAGVGHNLEEASSPAILSCKGHKIACFSISDHPSTWAASERNSGLFFINPHHYSDKDIQRIQEVIAKAKEKDPEINMVVVSFHWGPNYAWEPSTEIQNLAHDLISHCNVDVIHGHSSHHIQGIEIFSGKPIIYGCGDFVDDYAVDENYRNDLGFAYFLTFDSTCILQHIELLPTKIQAFSVTKDLPLADSKWLTSAMKSLCKKFGSPVYETQNGKLYIPTRE